MALAETKYPEQSAADFTSCDREPIHHIGAIQPVGFLIAISADWVVMRVSANVADHLDRSADAILGLQLHEVIAAEGMHTIRNRLLLVRGSSAVERALGIQLQDEGRRFDLAIHISGQLIVIEAEPAIPAGELNAGAVVRSMLARMQGQASLVREAARLIQALTGFDRVMIYRFHPDDSGEVIAERVRSGLEPYLGLRYPAEDIPRQARALLVLNPVRVLVDVNAPPSAILACPDRLSEPLDLSLSLLRAHSAMCLEFLRNMGVGATLTLSLVRDGKLWGLISCHHMTPRHVGSEQRIAAELFAQMLSFLIEKRERDELAAYEAQTRAIQKQIIATMVERGSAGDSIAALVDRLADLVPSDGIAVCVDGCVSLRGSTPTEEEFSDLRVFLDGMAAKQVYATDMLSHVYAPARDFIERAAGIIVIPISHAPRDYVVFFRHELARSVTWAGQPGKLRVTGSHGSRLTPRKSFEAWRETMHGHSAPWADSELRAAEAMRITLLEMVLHLTGMSAQESHAATRKQELLIGEINHRVRNILGLIRGLVSLSRRSANDVETYAAVLGDRVHALARVHDQITASNWGPGSFAAMVAAEATACLGAAADRMNASGPPILLQPQALSTVSLVIHELMTNAVNKGALAGPTGRIVIEWKLDANANVMLDWRETGGPPVQPPTQHGFGSTIIQHSIPHELGGNAAIDYAAAGLRAAFLLPAHHVVSGGNGIAAESVIAVAAPSVRLSGLVLLVEDNMIIAFDTEDILLSLGAARVTVAGSVAEALRMLETETPSFALLDVNLGSEMIWPVATRLRELGVRHVFATGYGSGIGYPPEHRFTRSITKPYTSDSIARAFGTPG